MKTALFAGTFRPFTIGHADIVDRALAVFDKVIICVGVNIEKSGHESEVEARLETIRRVYASDPRVEVVARTGLTVDTAKEFGASALLRGVRSAKDYEYERDMADANRSISGIETVILVSRPELAFISSSLVRDLQAHGRDASQYLHRSK